MIKEQIDRKKKERKTAERRRKNSFFFICILILKKVVFGQTTLKQPCLFMYETKPFSKSQLCGQLIRIMKATENIIRFEYGLAGNLCRIFKQCFFSLFRITIFKGF